MKRLLFNKWYGGISNDPNIGGAGSIFNAEGVEVRENSKKVKLSRGGYSNQYLSASDKVVGYNYYSSSNFLRLHSSGKISNLNKNDVDNGNYVTDLDGLSYNIGNLTTPAGHFGFIITSGKLYQWAYDGTDPSLGIYNSSSTGIIANGSFSSSTGWTVGAGWVIAGGQATHTAGGGTNALSYTSTTIIGVTYRIEVVCGTITSDSCQLTIGGVNQHTFTSADSGKTVVFNYTALANNEVVEFVPSSNFDGSFNNIVGQQYNVTSYVKTFNEKAPFITISNFVYIGNGNKITQIDTTSSTWVITDVLTIDLDYTIKGITKIGDQIFIYASNLSTTRQYLWDGISSSVNGGTITWIDKNCVNVANWANQDYIITSSASSNRTGLWLVDGYQLQDIFINAENTSANLERIYFQSNYTNAIETIGNRLLIPGNDGIYTYGQFTPGLPISLVKEYIHLGGEISAMSYNESNSNRIVYSYTGTINGITGIYEDLIQITNGYNRRTDMSGFIELQPQSGECISNIKDLEKLTIGAKLTSGTQINVYTKNEDRTIKYANIPYSDTTLPTVGAIYTSGGNTYTVYAVTDMTGYCILHCTYTGTALVAGGTFTKSSGTGDTSFYSERVRYDYKLIGTVTDTTKRRHPILDCAERYYEIQPAVELLTSSTSLTPEFSDINLYFNETNDD